MVQTFNGAKDERQALARQLRNLEVTVEAGEQAAVQADATFAALPARLAAVEAAAAKAATPALLDQAVAELGR